MPTHSATGVTGTLAICELRDAVSNVVDYKCGPEQHTDAIRMKAVIDAAIPLSEQVIGGDGAADGIVQYLGAQADMPLKMVVASMHGGQLPESAASEEEKFTEMMKALDSEADADVVSTFRVDSPLTSLGATSTSTLMRINTSPSKAVTGAQQPVAQISSPLPTLDSLEAPLPLATYISGPQSLILNINLTSKSFMPVKVEGCKRTLFDNKDLKVEVFVNGELAEVDYISGRRLAGKTKSIDVQYKGTRIHRQIEKPWAYMPSEVNTEAVQDAFERWSNISEALKRESAFRGTDKYGDTPPSGEYLMCLSQINMPATISDYKGLGVVDVVITAGRGQKYGSEVEYMVGPTRLDDDAYTSLSPFLDPELMLSSDVFMLALSSDSLFVSERGSSPEIPLAPVRTRATKFVLTTPASRSPRTGEELKESLGLRADLDETRIDGVENAHGQAITNGRTITQRLGDLKKMTPQKQNLEIAQLREEFGGDAIEEPARKKLKINAPTFDDAFEVEQPYHPLTTFSTPQKRTKASALANSPARVEVKMPRKYNKTQYHQDSQSAIGEWNDQPIPFIMNAHAATKAKRLAREVSDLLANGKPSRGAGRTSKKYLPKERTAASALAEFEVPGASVGSCVTFAPDLGVAGGGGAAVGGKVQRQVGKSRKGEFREAEVVVGFRFCVV